MAFGAAFNHYAMNLFGPAMIADLGWSKAEFALLGSVPLLTMAFIPLAGRFTDRFGTRIAAIVGFAALPLGFVAMSMMRGPIHEFFAIYLAQHFFGVLTTSMVFCRVIVERFDAARGIALSVVMSAPPLVSALAIPVVGAIIADHGWRVGFLSMAGISIFGGLVAVAFMGRSGKKQREAAPPKAAKLGRAELVALVRHPIFLLIAFGMFLVNVPQVFVASQMKLVMMDSGVSDSLATWMISLYAIGVMIGRFASGLALDRIEPHYVAMAALGLPAIGYLVLASHITATPLLIGAVMLIGLAQGAEADIGAFLISRRFDMKNFSLLLSILTMTIGFGSVAGSLVMSTTLHRDGYTTFLIVSAITTVLGAILFALTGAFRGREERRAENVEQDIMKQAMTGEIG